MSKGLNVKEISDLGLDAADIAIHQERIRQGLKSANDNFIPVIDACRLDNQGILPQSYVSSAYHSSCELDGFVAFVPAAGAASRYFQPLNELRNALAQGDADGIARELSSLHALGANQWPLPPVLQRLMQAGQTQVSDAERELLIAEIDSPKALLPYKAGQGSFLGKKVREHQKLRGLEAEVYVAPIGYSQAFAEHLAKEGVQAEPLFLEQGAHLSTLRFTRDGEPYRDESGALSMVPAGHGMLVRLFPEIRKRFPKAHSLFIRNIDNVSDDEAASVRDTENFLLQHQKVLKGLNAIRDLLAENEWEKAGAAAKALHESFASLRKDNGAWLDQESGLRYPELWRLLCEAFHCPAVLARDRIGKHEEKAALVKLYKRPLNALGQVPNSGKDVGGSPVRAVHGQGEVTICLELPHATEADKKTFFENPEVATHFNPVFVAAELPRSASVYDLAECPFWILAQKNIHGTPVVYHEIVLYEVLGNSYTANVLFPEIPRHLFKPHKTLLDGLKK